MNSVDSLLKQSFLTRTFAEKVKIKMMGKPTPELNIVQTAKGRKSSTTYTRRFHSEVYEKYFWMCGCEIRNALYCFPCLLFGNQDSWSRNGIRDLGHLSEYANKHMASKKHMGNVLDLNNVGSINVAAQYSESINRKREEVERNRYVLSKIIDCIKFCGEFDLALRGQFETDDSSKSGIFPGLVNLIASVDSAVKNDLVTNSVAQWTSKTVQHELLQCMLEICREKIKEELKMANFVAVMADETIDESEHMQMIIVYRYETQGIVYERFWGFSDPDGQTSSEISRCLLAELDDQFQSTPTKIIAQTFDGVAIMRRLINGIQSKIKEQYPLARYVHCYTHQVNLVMETAAFQNQAARVFFSSLSEFPAFFSRSPQRMSVLEKISERRIVTDSLTRRTINCVFENKEALVDCFRVLEQSFSDRTVQQARGLRRCLEDDEFLFWLDFFHKLMPHVTILYDQLQMKNMDASEVRHSVEVFRKSVNELRDSLDASNSKQPGYVKSKRVKMECNRVADAKDVCDRVMVETECRFESTSHLDISKLLEPKNFKTYSAKFPEKLLELAVKSYPMLNRGKLMSELSLLYERCEFTNVKGAIPLLKLLYSNNLIEVFGETATLLRIIVTIPMTNEEPEQCFSSKKRIKTFLRNPVRDESLTALAMLSIEKKLVANITDFNSKAIDRFANKTNRRVDLIF